VGCVLALMFALLTYVRVSSTGLAYRNPEIWSNVATLGLTTPGAPEWRSIPPPGQQPLSALVDTYAAYATSDQVIESLQRQGLLPRAGATVPKSAISASAVPSPVNGQPTPLLSITGTATTPAAATTLTIAATQAFIDYARSRQDADKIPESQRVDLRIIRREGEPTLTAPRSKTSFIIVLLAGLTATVAAAFVRDNMHRARRRQDQPEPVSTLDPLLRDAEAPIANGSEPRREGVAHGPQSGGNEAGDGSHISTISQTRRSARSSR
jgi:hypothetical protein